MMREIRVVLRDGQLVQLRAGMEIRRIGWSRHRFEEKAAEVDTNRTAQNIRVVTSRRVLGLEGTNDLHYPLGLSTIYHIPILLRACSRFHTSDGKMVKCYSLLFRSSLSSFCSPGHGGAHPPRTDPSSTSLHHQAIVPFTSSNRPV